MKNEGENIHSWKGKQIKVNILYSRAGITQHIWVSNDNGSILIDTGDGILRDLLSNKLDLDQIRGIVFTHGHFDHVGGLHSLLGYLRMIGRNQTLKIFAPKGCKEVFSILNNFIKCYPDTIPFKITQKEIQPREVFQIAGMTVESYLVVHCGGIKGFEIFDQIPALGYRISYKDESIAISGDTGVCPSLKELVKDADLAILEATLEKSEGVDKVLLEKVHLSEDLAKEIGKLSKDFILIHKGRRKES